MPVDAIEDYLKPGLVVCTARVSGDRARSPQARVLERIDLFHGEVPERFEIRYDWFDPSREENAHNVPLRLGRDHLFALEADKVPGRFALHGSWWLRNQPVEYFERNYRQFLSSIPVVVQTERIGDAQAKLTAQSRLLEGPNDELVAYACRALSARWNVSHVPRDAAVLAEIEERLLAFCTRTEREMQIRHYAIGRVASLRHEGGAWPSLFPEAFAEMAGKELDDAVRWRAASALRWLARERRIVPRGSWDPVIDACVAALLADRSINVCEELAMAIAEMGPADDATLGPLDRAGSDRRFFATSIRDFWMASPEARRAFDPVRFQWRR